MSKVLLSQEELHVAVFEKSHVVELRLFNAHNPVEVGNWETWIARAQARHLLKVLDEPCPHCKSYSLKRQCPTCMNEIKKEVGE